MPFYIVRDDITKMSCDAIVNAANRSLLGGGGVDGAIHRAAGKELLFECATLGGCKKGQAKITGAYNLPCKYVIHTVGPVWRGGSKGEGEALRSCYEQSLKLAKEKELSSVAFPLISTGAYGYPKAEALKIALDAIGAFLLENDMTVYLVVFDDSSFEAGSKLFSNISEYIDGNYAEEMLSAESSGRFYFESRTVYENHPVPGAVCGNICAGDIERAVGALDESFSQMLLRKIDEKNITDVQCYRRANADRRLFSKIRANEDYKPKKTTAVAFAVALELSLPETKELLMKAGYALSHSCKFDVIIEYFIERGNYNIFEINEALFAFDQCLLGA